MRSYSDGVNTVEWEDDAQRVTINGAGQETNVPFEFLSEVVELIRQQEYRRLAQQQASPFLPMVGGLAARQGSGQNTSTGPGESPESSPTNTPGDL